MDEHCLFCAGRSRRDGRNGKSLTTRFALVSHQDFSRGGISDVAPVGMCHLELPKGPRIRSGYLWLLWILGNAYQGNGNDELALRVRKRAIEISPVPPFLSPNSEVPTRRQARETGHFEVLKQRRRFQAPLRDALLGRPNPCQPEAKGRGLSMARKSLRGTVWHVVYVKFYFALTTSAATRDLMTCYGA